MFQALYHLLWSSGQSMLKSIPTKPWRVVALLALLMGGCEAVSQLTGILGAKHVQSSQLLNAYNFKNDPPLPPEMIAYGELQLKAMLHDRPAMRRLVQPGDPIWNWSTRQFAGEGTGGRIAWSKEPPAGSVVDSNCLPPESNTDGSNIGYIRVREARILQGTERLREGEDLWASAIYELNNVKIGKPYRLLYDSALAGKIGKDEWIKGCLRLEFGSMMRTAVVYETLWKPLMDSRGVETDPWIYQWGLVAPSTPEAWIDSIFEPGFDGPVHATLAYYNQMWQKSIAPYSRHPSTSTVR